MDSYWPLATFKNLKECRLQIANECLSIKSALFRKSNTPPADFAV